MKEMSVERAKEIIEQAKKTSRIDPSDGLVISTGEGPSFVEVAKAVEVLKREEAKKKEMSVEEAKKILAEAGKAMRIDPSDGLVMATGKGPSFAEVAKAASIMEAFAERMKVVKAAKAVVSKNGMSVWEAKNIIKKHKEHTNAEGVSDGKGPAREKVLQAEIFLEQKRDQEIEKLKSGEIRPKRVEVLSQKEVYEILRQNSAEMREKPFLERLFSKKEKPFCWEDSMEWRDVKFQTPQGQVLFSHRIDLEYLTPAQERRVRAGLRRHGIQFEERRATRNDGIIRKGDRTFRISDAKSVERLRFDVFNWAMQGRAISMSVEEYNKRLEESKRAKPYVPRQSPLPPEPERPFNWQDSMCWQDVKFQSKGEVLFSHRVRLEGLTAEQEKEMKEGLAKYHINYEERKASFDDDKIKAGDRTLRISDKESIAQLRSMVFNWAQGSCARPVSMPVEEYQAEKVKQAVLAARQSEGK